MSRVASTQSGSANPQRTAAILKFYANGWSLRRLAARYSVSAQRIHQILVCHAPHLIRPVGRPVNGKGK